MTCTVPEMEAVIVSVKIVSGCFSPQPVAVIIKIVVKIIVVKSSEKQGISYKLREMFFEGFREYAGII